MHLPEVGYDHFVELWRPATEPEITVVMPLYRQKDYVRASIPSVLSQRGVCAEVILSDDGSNDGTFEEALRAVSDWLERPDCGHRIVVRKGKQRLWRDHLPLLVDNACCDLVCQAHGDDVSTPDRCLKLVSVFEADPLISLVASEEALFAGSRCRCRETKTENGHVALRQYTCTEIIDGQTFLVGALLAWRKTAVSRFARLDSRFAAASHDRILAFRASLTGKVMLLQEPLVKRREHPLQASRLLFHEPYRSCSFGRSLFRLNALWAMRRDLHRALDLALISQDTKGTLEGEIDRRLAVFQQGLVESFRVYTYAGKHIAWVDEDTLRRLNVSSISRIKLRMKPLVVPLGRKATFVLHAVRNFPGSLRRAGTTISSRFRRKRPRDVLL
jgi:hypothetical protein